MHYKLIKTAENSERTLQTKFASWHAPKVEQDFSKIEKCVLDRLLGAFRISSSRKFASYCHLENEKPLHVGWGPEICDMSKFADDPSQTIAEPMSGRHK
jgi:hypothetical protein